MSGRESAHAHAQALARLDVFECPLEGINLIEASAGTGKTWNICALYLRLLLERQHEVSQILVVTFTNAAAAELRDRIRKRLLGMLGYLNGAGPASGDPFYEQLAQALQCRQTQSPKGMLRTLERALTGFDEAAILTIHGFCQRALADAPFSARMPLGLTRLEDDSEWLAEVVNDFWRRRIVGGELEPVVVAHLQACDDTPARFAKVLRQHLDRPLARVEWPQDIDANYRVDESAVRTALAQARALWSGERDEIVAMVRGASGLSKTYYKSESIDQAVLEWDRLVKCAELADVVQIRPDKASLFAQATLIRRTNKTSKTPTPSHRFFGHAQDLVDLMATATRHATLVRLRLMRDLISEAGTDLVRLKRKCRVIAFNDMLSNLHERLHGAEGAALAATLGQRYPAALIDEFQDTDPSQFDIFDAIYGSARYPFFMVGDPKQAIYSFRNADLHTYLAARDSASARYTIVGNQRSSQALITALNGLFSRTPGAFMLPGLEYPVVEVGQNPRAAFRDSSGSRPGALQLWSLPSDPESGKPLRGAEAQGLSIRACAGEIARLLAASARGEIELSGQAMQAGDMAVLVRSHAHGTRMRLALTTLGIGCVQRTQETVYASGEAEELERVLLAILSPVQERVVRAALATEAMGLDAGAIVALDDESDSVLQDAMQRLMDYRALWQSRGAEVMLRRWFSRERVAERLLCRIDGERRLTNLLHLFECLHQAERQHPSTEALMAWFQTRRRDPRPDDASQLRLESDENLVQIVTVHTAKGLEYPIVFCPLLWTGSRLGAGSSVAAYYIEQGRAVFDYRRVINEDFAKDGLDKRVKASNDLESAAESLRLIYVALTRAVHRCVLVTGSYCTGKSTAASARGMLNWLVAGAGHSPAQWFTNKLEPGDIDRAWQAFADEHQDSVSLMPLPVRAGESPDTPPPELPGEPSVAQALPTPSPAPRGWRIGSYSALAHGARHERAAVDHDLRTAPSNSMYELDGLESAAEAADSTTQGTGLTNDSGRVTPTPDFTVEADDILNFPRGAGAGDCLHRIFENIDFTLPADWPAVIDKSLRALQVAPGNPESHRAVANTEADLGQQRRRVLSMLSAVTHTRLPIGTDTPLLLSELDPARRLNEMEFHMPVNQLSANDMNRVLQAAGQAHPALGFADLSGYFKGFIDLILEHQGRYFVLDWKSNHLGSTLQHYAHEPLARAMDDNNYRLQALVYSVALHRYLQRRLSDYDPELHFGGSVYLFLRGVRPEWSCADGRPAGMVFERPSPPLLERMSALFARPHNVVSA